MKIGIITWFSGTNYGTHLQAVALYKYLHMVGHDVQIVNFEVEVDTKISKKTFWQKMCFQPEKYMTKYAFWKYHKDIKKKNQSLRELINRECLLTDRVESKEDYIRICNQFDLLVCGSDQIWNPNWYHEYYYADYSKVKVRKISYAPSIGVNVIPDALKETIKRSLASFEAISIREERGAEILAPIAPVKPQVVVDPTLLLDASEWLKLAANVKLKKEKPYVLSMFLTDDCAHWHASRKFAKEKGLQHVIIPYCGFSYVQRGHICTSVSAEELINLIKNAKYVLTDSFHITVFSLIFNRQFVTFQRFRENAFTSTNARVKNLLKMAGIQERLIAHRSKKVPKLGKIDYEKVNLKLRRAIEQSKLFIQEAIDGK